MVKNSSCGLDISDLSARYQKSFRTPSKFNERSNKFIPTRAGLFAPAHITFLIPKFTPLSYYHRFDTAHQISILYLDV